MYQARHIRSIDMVALRRTGTLKMRFLNHAGCVSMCVIYTTDLSNVESSSANSAGAGEKGAGMGCVAGLRARCLAFGAISNVYGALEGFNAVSGRIGIEHQQALSCGKMTCWSLSFVLQALRADVYPSMTWRSRAFPMRFSHGYRSLIFNPLYSLQMF